MHVRDDQEEYTFALKNANPIFEEVLLDARELHPHTGSGRSSSSFTTCLAMADSARLAAAVPNISWARYLVGVLEGLKEHHKGKPLRGFTGFIMSDIPTGTPLLRDCPPTDDHLPVSGAGISSSHSLVMSFMTACLLSNPDIAIDPIEVLNPPAFSRKP